MLSARRVPAQGATPDRSSPGWADSLRLPGRTLRARTHCQARITSPRCRGAQAGKFHYETCMKLLKKCRPGRSLLASLCFVAGLAGQTSLADPADGGHATVELVAEREIVQPGETFYAAFDLVIAEGWHVYWRNPGDAGLPPKANWTAGAAAVDGEFVWPIPKELVVVEGQIMDYGYDERLVLPFAVNVPVEAAGEFELSGKLDYLICEEICIPETAAYSLRLPVAERGEVNVPGGRLIADWIERAPARLEGEACLTDEGDTWLLSMAAPALAQAGSAIRFFPYDNEISHSAAQVARFGEQGASLDLVPGYAESFPDELAGIVVLEDSAGRRTGHELRAIPCAVPLAATSGLASLAEPAAFSAARFALIGLMALAGGLVLNLMPCVLPVLSLKAFGMVETAARGDAARLRAHGWFYTGGVLVSFLAIGATFVALRSAGEFLSLGFQLQYPAVVALLALLMFVIGLWLFGTVTLGSSVQGVGNSLATQGGSAGAFFTGVLAAVVGAPCIGPFLGIALGAVISQPAAVVLIVFALVGFGLALPFLALSHMPGLSGRLPKPGLWMERLKQVFAFPMFLTAIWLLSVLGSQVGMGPVVWTLVGAVIIGFAAWAFGNRERRVFAVAGLLVAGAGVFLPVWASLSALPRTETASATGGLASAAVAWAPETVAEAIRKGQGVFVDFTATWCATCQVNKLTTLRSGRVRDAFARADIVFMVADFTNRDERIARELEMRGRAGVPMYLLYDPGEPNPKILPQLLSENLVLEEIERILSEAET